jgi:hypothetical protein
MIETYNESRLHQSLKVLYAERSGGKTEQEVAGKICDILTPDGGVIEIQTGSLAHLASKIALLAPRRAVRVVYPLVTEKYIETCDEEGRLLYRRKSPKKQGIYSMFRELTGIYPWLSHPNFSLEVLEVTVTENRIRTAQPVQLVNKSRRFLRNWYKTGKELRTIGASRVFSGAASWAALLPFAPGEKFSTRELAVSGAGTYAGLMIWVLQKLELIAFTEKRGKTTYFSRCD